MTEYKTGDVVALRATVSDPEFAGEVMIDGVWYLVGEDVRPWPDAERMARLEAALVEIRAVSSVAAGHAVGELGLELVISKILRLAAIALQP